MRNCEAFALQWQDINFEENTIHINKSSSQKVKGVRNYIGTTKTLSSYRVIYMPKELHSTLCTLQVVAIEKAIHHKNNYIFSINGTLPIAETTMNKRRIKYSIKANVPIISCHKIRHTHISHLIANGANPMAVANRVGHVSTKMTLDTYGHSINKADKELLTIISTSYTRVE